MNGIVLALPGNEAMAAAIAQAEGLELGAIETRRFPDGETYLRHLSDLDGKSVALVCTLNDPDAKLVPLLFAARAARDQGAGRVGLVAPYLAYMRQDKAFRRGEGVSARYFADMLAGALDWLVTVEPHLHRIAGLERIFPIPTRALRVSPLLADWIRHEVKDPVLIGPDAESRQWVTLVADCLSAPYAVARKRRLGDRRVRIDMPDLSPFRDRTPVLVDDVVSSGRTLLELAGRLDQAFPSPPYCAVVHGLFGGHSYARLEAACQAVASTNTVPHPSNAVDVSADIGAALRDLI
ncbi:ribose-phosphate diphosphokinase [Actibacterium sp. MT2.3-13A]|uniref:ribose-phosphate diphosphokinase n=1 Tax=Actibacterium sp. MT2.3-13A TaxID=2828332 RepID=UPI001BAC394C|nr:ribose-phosphate diphosphokinase [Actibacterium sp. MT2.3-13A]